VSERRGTLAVCYVLSCYSSNKELKCEMRCHSLIALSGPDDITAYQWVEWMTLQVTYARSPRIRLANWISLGMMVTRLAWMAHKLVSSKRPTR